MEINNKNNSADGVHSQDYYELENGKHASDYIYTYGLGFSYGNAFKYCTRCGKKEGNSVEKDLNKAMTYILSSDSEYSFIERLAKRALNTWLFNDRTQFAPRNLADILCAIIKFESKEKIAKLIVRYMKFRGVNVKPEYKCYE